MVDKETGGNALHLICSSCLATFIQQNGERQAQVLGKSLYSFPSFSDINRQDDETLILILLVGVLQSGPLATAVWSPRSPEIQQHHSSLQVTETAFVARQIR